MYQNAVYFPTAVPADLMHIPLRRTLGQESGIRESEHSNRCTLSHTHTLRHTMGSLLAVDKTLKTRGQYIRMLLGPRAKGPGGDLPPRDALSGAGRR